MSKEYLAIVKQFKTEFKNYVNMHEDIGVDDPIKTKVFAHPIDPIKANNGELPAFFFGYGAARINDTQYGTGYQGETISIIINAVVGKLDTFEGETIDDITDSAAVIHQIVRGFVLNETTIVDLDDGMPISPTMEFRLAGVDTDAQGVSEREFMTFTIEIDWAYPAYVE